MHILFSPACRALVDEMEWAISQIDPKKMIQTGSFRINPDGSQSVKEVTYFSFILTQFFFFLFGFSNTNLQIFIYMYLFKCAQVPFSRSESHLLELMEEVCEKMNDYGERVDPATNRKTYVRHTSRDGTAMDLSDVAFDSRVSSSLKFAVRMFSFFSTSSHLYF